MRIDDREHLALPWLVHDLVADFDLEDVWRLPVEGDLQPGSNFEAFVSSVQLEPPDKGATAMLFRLRLWLGKVFGWDGDERLPVPDCEEISVASRMPPELAKNVPAFDPEKDFQLLYTLDDERLLEISNSTVHALLHWGWVKQDNGRYGAQMAVYAKPRGLFGRLYMASIKPFRLWVVYPALLAHIGRQWRNRLSVAA